MSYDSRYKLYASPVWVSGSTYNISVTSQASQWFDYHSYVAYAYQNTQGGYTWDSSDYYAMTQGSGVLYYHNGTLYGYTSSLGSFLLRAYFFSSASQAANALASSPGDNFPWTYVQVDYPPNTTNYTITYNNNGATSGSTDITSTTAVSGSSIKLSGLGTCEKTGYEADGWANSANGDKAYDFEQTYTVSSNKTFYLHWVRNVFNMTVTNDGHGTASVSSATVNAGDSVTFTATPNTGYGFVGWYNNGSLISNSNPYTFYPLEDTTLQAVFEDISTKASYLWEHVTNTAYQLKDSAAIQVTGTPELNHIARWYNASNAIANGYTLTYASAAPATQKNGEIYAINSENYPNDTDWVKGSSQDWGGEYVSACIKVTVASETATSITYHVVMTSYVTSFNGGIDSPYFGWYIYNNGSTYTSQTGTGDTWNASWGGSGYSTSHSADITITKTSSTQNRTLGSAVSATGYSTASVTKNIVVPPIGYSACVGHSGSWKPGRCMVLYNGAWTDACMYIFDGTQFVKAHYY